MLTDTSQELNNSINENDIQLNNSNIDDKKKPEKTSNSSYCEHIDVEKGQVDYLIN